MVETPFLPRLYHFEGPVPHFHPFSFRLFFFRLVPFTLSLTHSNFPPSTGDLLLVTVEGNNTRRDKTVSGDLPVVSVVWRSSVSRPPLLPQCHRSCRTSSLRDRERRLTVNLEVCRPWVGRLLLQVVSDSNLKGGSIPLRSIN